MCTRLARWIAEPHFTSTHQTSLGEVCQHISNEMWYGRATGIAITITPTCSNVIINITDITADGNEGFKGGNMNILYTVFDPTNHIIVSNSCFSNGYAHSGDQGGGVNIYSVWHDLPQGNIEFMNCTFENNIGTAVFLSPSSSLIFQGNILFRNNSGENGGALFFSENSQIFLCDKTTINFSNNSATRTGGAIWAPSEFIPVPLCFFQLVTGIEPRLSTLKMHHITLNYRHNYAKDAGSLLYGGAIDNCLLKNLSQPQLYSSKGVFNGQNTDFHKSEVSSDPIGVCFCIDNAPDCTWKVRNITKYPGEDFLISATTVGQRDGTVPGDIIAELNDMNDNCSFLGDLQQTQRVSTSRSCANLTYTVFSNHERLFLSLKRPIATTAMAPNFTFPILHITLQKCPPGFSLSNSSGRFMCDCAPVLKNYGTTCNITSKTIHRKPPVWIGYYNATGQKNKSGLLLHPHCPLDYCQLNDIKMNLSTPGKQCAKHRSGILCGACQPGFSLALGTSQCLRCSNNYLALLLVFAVAGVGLVFLLFVCNLTVTEGTLNGLIFYANIIWINRSIYFPTMATNPFTIFIAWLNLDLGFQTCFYDGLDTYAKVWLQFVFPIYIWLLVIALTYLSHRFTRVAGLVGNNAVKVLSTLFLLSYSKLQRTIIAALSITTLTYPDGSKEWLWLYDANIQYFGMKHIPLLISALLVLLLLSLPYALLLFFIQWIRRIGGNRWKFQKWIAKLLPLFDAYTAPYKFQYQFWIGFLLLVRSILFLVFAVNYSDQTSWNLMATVITCLFILTLAWSLNGVYQTKCLDILESSFLLNLGTVSVVTLYYTLTQEGNPTAVMYTSIGAALVKFAVVVAFHFFWKTSVGKAAKKPFLCMANIATATLRNYAVKVKSLIPKKSAALNYDPEADEDENQPLLQAAGNTGPGCYDQYREPWLEYIKGPDSEN